MTPEADQVDSLLLQLSSTPLRSSPVLSTDGVLNVPIQGSSTTHENTLRLHEATPECIENVSSKDFITALEERPEKISATTEMCATPTSLYPRSEIDTA